MRQLLDSGNYTLGTRIWSTWPLIAELLGQSGKYDFFEFTAEYSPFTQADLENLCRTAELYHMGSIIKIDFQNRFYVAQKAIAAGFNAVLFADHKTPEEVRETIYAIRPDSLGEGRFGKPSSRFNFSGSSFIGTEDYASLLRDIVVILMIEKKEAVDNLEEILSVPGVDMVQWGPADFSLSMGWNRFEKDEELRRIERYVMETAMKKGIPVRCEIPTYDKAKYYLELGVKHFCLGDEVMNNVRWWNSEGDHLRELFPHE